MSKWQHRTNRLCILRKHKLALHKLFDKQVSLLGEKRLIVQRGGFLLTLMAAVLPTVDSLIGAKEQVRYTSSRPRTTALRLLQRENLYVPFPDAASNDPQSSTPTLSGLSCELSIAKLNYDVMHGLRSSLIL